MGAGRPQRPEVPSRGCQVKGRTEGRRVSLDPSPALGLSVFNPSWALSPDPPASDIVNEIQRSPGQACHLRATQVQAGAWEFRVSLHIWQKKKKKAGGRE